LPPALSAKDLRGGRTQILNIRRIRRNKCYQVKSDEDSTPESISDTEDSLNWNGDLDNPKNSEDDSAADVESDIEKDNRIEELQCPEQRDVSAVPYVPRLIQPRWKSKMQAEKV